MQRVFVLDKNRQPLMSCHPARARDLLGKGKAAVYRMKPFTLILKDREGGVTQTVAVKLDPGSKTTGMALVAEYKKGPTVIWAGELTHHGEAIKMSLLKRKAIRRNRRARNTRYRAPRFMNRLKGKGWLPPSLLSRIGNIDTLVAKLRSRCPITSISMELTKFDTQAMENPEISGKEYQHGELAGYEVREYLLEKFNRTCAYCGATDTPLQIEHIIPKARGGSDRVSNLTIACGKCNTKKGTKTAEEFGHPEVQAQAKKPLKDAAAMNATRWEIYRRLVDTGLPVEIGSGGLTKFNRSTMLYPKVHWIDAACVGKSGIGVILDSKIQALGIKSMGRGNRQMCRMDKFGFPRTGPKTVKRVGGFQTGDLVRSVILKGKYKGVYHGILSGVRSTGTVDIKSSGKKISSNLNNFTIIQKMDGYEYTTQATGTI